MRLLRLSLQNFKNHPALELQFRQGFNFILGPNGSGKTNILDAIHYLSFTRSYFNLQDSQNITHEAPYMVVETESDAGTVFRMGLKRGGRKQLSKDGVNYVKMSEHLGQIPAVMITPFDTDLIFEGSEPRRKFMDQLLCQVSAVYMSSLAAYGRALEQRNAQLKRFISLESYDHSYLEAWDAILCREAPLIFESRRQLMQELEPRIREYYSHLSGGNEQAQVLYQSDLQERSMQEVLQANLAKDRVLERTSRGVHRDDLELLLDGFPLVRTGSQGQQKSYILAMKLAAAAYLKEKLGMAPLMLLDDVFDRLDQFRTARLLQLLEQEELGQVFLTHTDPLRVEEIFGPSYQQQVVIHFPSVTLKG